MFQMVEISDLETMVQSYAVNSLLLYVVYFFSQVTAIDPKARLAEDSEMVAAKVEELNKIENGDDEAAKDQVSLRVVSEYSATLETSAVSTVGLFLMLDLLPSHLCCVGPVFKTTLF
jgi:hypothetical protein